MPPKKRVLRRKVDDKLPENDQSLSVWEAYLLNKKACYLHSVPNPKTKNCRDNPYCLERLGLEKWVKLLSNMESDNKETERSSDRRNVDEMPCGLLNLGNSCYVNSFIQIFFNDPVFRRLIYEWRPVENYVQPSHDLMNIQELMLCLQELFVTLQITPYEDASADALVNLLRLDGRQHDALEFQILLFGKIDKLLSYRSEWHHIRNQIIDRFKGTMIRTVTCSCGKKRISESPFHPFCLGIEKIKSLSKALEKYFSSEELHDYTCDFCNKSGHTTSMFSIKESPPVLIIQLNRFTYDATGRKRKVQSALQYPRSLELGGSIYEICAVMIHEGPNADSGHYYDVIKHPGCNQWFIYNDETVKPSPSPGVTTEKERISKVTPDMKGCYALVYRRISESNEPVPDVPSHIADSIISKLEEDFIIQTSTTTETSTKWLNTVKVHYEKLCTLWRELQIQNGAHMLLNAENITFIPTDLLIDVLQKEFDFFENNGKAKNSLDDEDSSLTIAKLAQLNNQQNQYTIANLNMTSIKLCNHGLVSLDNVQNGSVKAVDREAVEKLLLNYKINLELLHKEKNMFERLQTGKDICSNCVTAQKADENFSQCVMAGEKLAKQLLKERNKRLYHSENCLWVSIRSLNYYRKIAYQAKELRNKTDAKYNQLNFKPSSNKFLLVGVSFLVGKEESTLDAAGTCGETSVNHMDFSLPTNFIGDNSGTHIEVSSSTEAPKISDDENSSNSPYNCSENQSFDPVASGEDNEMFECTETKQSEHNKASTSSQYCCISPEPQDEGNSEMVENQTEQDETQNMGSSPSLSSKKRSFLASDSEADNCKKYKVNRSDSEEMVDDNVEREFTSNDFHSLFENGSCDPDSDMHERDMIFKGVNVTSENNSATDDSIHDKNLSVSAIQIPDKNDTPIDNNVFTFERKCSISQNSDKDSSNLCNEVEIENKENVGESYEHEEVNEISELRDEKTYDTADVESVSTSECQDNESGYEVDDVRIFNGHLRCRHGKLDYESWVKFEKRIIISREEWHRLVNGVFDEKELFLVDADSPPCESCRKTYELKVDSHEGLQRRIKEIRLAIGDLVRMVLRQRETRLANINSYNRVICADFLERILLIFKSRNVTRLPEEICQSCILCDKHRLPHIPLSSESPALPLTLDEWKRIKTAIGLNEEEVEEIEIDEGTYKNFCESCCENVRIQKDNQRFVYENATDIFVKLKSDRNDEPSTSSSMEDTSPMFLTSKVRAATTRRTAAKSFMKFRLNSSNTIRDLKLKIYESTGQLPSDQLLYFKDRLLNDTDTLEEARIDPKELSETPLILIVQQLLDSPNEPRQLERGFADTALSQS